MFSISFEQFKAIAMQCGVAEKDLFAALTFLNDIGELLWLNEDGLIDTIVLDSIQLLVKPATTIIRKLRSTAHTHETDAHRECAVQYFKEYRYFKESDIGGVKMIEFLVDKLSTDRVTVLHLMTKFGLIVPVSHDEIRIDTSHDKIRRIGDVLFSISHFLIPAMLPLCARKSLLTDEWSGEEVHTCSFAFGACYGYREFRIIAEEVNLQSKGFLPLGLFERLLGKIAALCQSVTEGFSLIHMTLFSNVAVFVLGSQRFRVLPQPNINCIQLDAEGRNPLVVYERVSRIVYAIIEQCMFFLQGNSFLPYKRTSNSYLELESVRTAVSGIVSILTAFTDTLSADKLAEIYGCWVREKTSSKLNYDVFLSYRWNDFDTRLADALFDKTASDQVVITKNNRAINVYIDRN